MTHRIKIIFTISILFNVLFVGMVAGNFYHRINPPQAVSDIDHSIKELIKDKMVKSGGDTRAEIKKIRAHKDSLKNIITANEFDLEAYNTVVDKILTSKNDMGRQKAEKMGEVLQSLSREERQKISKRFLKGMMGGPKKPPHLRRRHDPQNTH